MARGDRGTPDTSTHSRNRHTIALSCPQRYQNLNPGQDTREQTTKRTHNADTKAHTKAHTSASRKTNQPTNQPARTHASNKQPQPPPHSDTRARRPAGSAPARAPLTAPPAPQPAAPPGAAARQPDKRSARAERAGMIDIRRLHRLLIHSQATAQHDCARGRAATAHSSQQTWFVRVSCPGLRFWVTQTRARNRDLHVSDVAMDRYQRGSF